MGTLRARVGTAALVCLDTASYAAVVVAVTTCLAFVVGIATGGGFPRMKALLFVAGFGLMAYSTARLWPRSPEELDRGGIQGVSVPNGGSVPAPERETRFESMARKLPPVRWLGSPPPEHRLSPAGKLFWSSVGVLLVSFLMETVFGVV
jgi:hypothetical protein